MLSLELHIKADFINFADFHVTYANTRCSQEYLPKNRCLFIWIYNREQKDSNVLNQEYFYSCMKQISENFLESFWPIKFQRISGNILNQSENATYHIFPLASFLLFSSTPSYSKFNKLDLQQLLQVRVLGADCRFSDLTQPGYLFSIGYEPKANIRKSMIKWTKRSITNSVN